MVFTLDDPGLSLPLIQASEYHLDLVTCLKQRHGWRRGVSGDWVTGAATTVLLSLPGSSWLFQSNEVNFQIKSRPMDIVGFSGGSDGKESPYIMQETRVWSLGCKDPLEKGTATHSSILAWRIPWTEELGGLESMGLQRVEHDWATNTSTFTLWTYHAFQVGLVVENPPATAGDTRDVGSIPGSGRCSGEGNGNPLQCSCLEKFHGQRSLAGYSPWGGQELDTTTWLSACAHTHTNTRTNTHMQGMRRGPLAGSWQETELFWQPHMWA